jgi:hypothetical protein
MVGGSSSRLPSSGGVCQENDDVLCRQPQKSDISGDTLSNELSGTVLFVVASNFTVTVSVHRPMNIFPVTKV